MNHRISQSDLFPTAYFLASGNLDDVDRLIWRSGVENISHLSSIGRPSRCQVDQFVLYGGNPKLICPHLSYLQNSTLSLQNLSFIGSDQ